MSAMTFCIPGVTGARRLVAWVCILLLTASASAADAGLSVVCEINGRSLPLAGVDKRQFLVRDGAGTKPAPDDVAWRIEGDLVAHANLVGWFPRHTKTRPANFELMGRDDMYEEVTVSWEGLETDFLRSAEERTNPFLKQWQGRPPSDTPGIAIALWLINGRAVKVLPYIVPVANGGINLAHWFSFVLSREESVGQPALLFWHQGSFVEPEPAFSHAATQRAFVATLLDDVTALDQAAGSGAKLKTSLGSGLNLAGIAATAGAGHTLEYLLKRYPGLLKKQDKGITPMIGAIYAGRANTVRLLLAGESERGRKSNLISAAASAGHVEVVRELIRAGFYDRDNIDVLGSAIGSGKTGIAECLVAAGLKFDSMRPSAGWALVDNAQRGNVALVKLLLAHGVSPDATQFAMPDWDKGMTALMGAAEGKSVATAELLLKQGADASRKSSWGVTALQIAAKADATEVIELLLTHGADVTARNRDNDSALDIALLGCAPDSARTLARKGARIDLKAANSAKLIEYALRFDCPEVIAGALADGWSPHALLKGGWPALAVAREFAADTCEKMLRNAGARDEEGTIAPLVQETELDVPLKSVVLKPPADPRPTANRSMRKVNVRLLIGADGHALFARAADTNDRELTAAILTAVDSWEFTKPLQGGNAVATRLALPVVFKGTPEPGYESVSYRPPVVLYRVLPRFPVMGSYAGGEMSALLSPGGGDGFGVFMDKPSETGRVVLGFDVDATGAVKNIDVKLSYEPAFATAAVAALKQWSFQPGISEGRPVGMAMVLQFRFAPPYYIWTGVPFRNFTKDNRKSSSEK